MLHIFDPHPLKAGGEVVLIRWNAFSETSINTASYWVLWNDEYEAVSSDDDVKWNRRYRGNSI